MKTEMWLEVIVACWIGCGLATCSQPNRQQVENIVQQECHR